MFSCNEKQNKKYSKGLENYQQTFFKENMKAAPVKSHFSFTLLNS